MQQTLGYRHIYFRWFGRMNATDALLNPVKDRNEPIDRETLEFEGLMIEKLLNTSGWLLNSLRLVNLICFDHYSSIIFLRIPEGT